MLLKRRKEQIDHNLNLEAQINRCKNVVRYDAYRERCSRQIEFLQLPFLLTYSSSLSLDLYKKRAQQKMWISETKIKFDMFETMRIAYLRSRFRIGGY